MNKEFIPYTEALALKELGFDEDCFAIWSGIDELNFSITDTIRLYSSEFRIDGNQSSKFYINDFNSLRVAAPTYSQALRWFREKYGLAAQFVYYHVPKWTFEILEFTEIKLTPSKIVVEYSKPRTYEEAELECLKKLIEIIKQK